MASSQDKIQLLRLAHVHYQHPNLAQAKAFLLDFGLDVVEENEQKIFYRGYGIDPYCYVAEQSPPSSLERRFVAGAFVVQSYQELEKAVKLLPGASPVRKAEGPGGGFVVEVPDPNGHTVRLLHGQQEYPQGEHLAKSQYNTSQDKERQGKFHRFKHGPSKVHKLGHFGFMVPLSKFLSTRSWYLNTFNFLITDSVFDGETDIDVTSFMHIDLGDTYTDHHGVFVAAEPANPDFPVQIHHSSFEVHDMDSQNLGHQWLEEKGWTNCWGVGRHLLGSQIFDYWFDPSGFILEHYADGDLVNRNTGVHREKAAKHSLYVWGPNLPRAFLSANVKDFEKIPVVERGLVPS